MKINANHVWHLVPKELRDTGHHVAVIVAGQERPKVQRMARDLLPSCRLDVAKVAEAS